MVCAFGVRSHSAAVFVSAMWSQLALCVFVGLAYASANPTWKDNTEYVYSVNGRTLSSLQEAAAEYSGIFLKAKLHMWIRPDGKLQGKVTDSKYAQIQSHLPNGWKEDVPNSKLSFKPLGLSEKPFQMNLENGLITDLEAERELTNWEANIIKSIVSQFQMDIQGKNGNPERFDAVFKTMEETVTGKTETIYEIHPLPDYLIQSQPWLAPQQKLGEGGYIVEINKYKNYSNSEVKQSYHHGFGDMKDVDPASNKMGEFFIRESSSRAIITGKPSRHVIQNSYTINKMMVNPDLKNKEMGSVVSMVNVTLSEVNERTSYPDLERPKPIGNLLYVFEKSFDAISKQDSMGDSSSSEETTEGNWRRMRRSLGMSSSEEDAQKQSKTHMSQALASPLLLSMSDLGKSMKRDTDFDIKHNVEILAEEICKEMQQPEEILAKATLNKYTILSTLVRLMDEDQINSVAEQLYSESQNSDNSPWPVYRDAVAEAGTEPAFSNIEKWIKSSKIQKREAADVVATMAQEVRAPTETYMRNFFDLLKSAEVQKQAHLNESAILSFTNLVHRVYGNRNESNNQFAVNAYGSFFTKSGRTFAESTVIPYLSEQLQSAVSLADSYKIHLYIRALGNVGHKKIIEAFQPYLEGEKKVSQFQRMWIVASLDRLVSDNPAAVRPVLHKIYQNTAEVPEVRVIAVHQLVRTNPPAEMLHRMAQYTKTDSQEKVNAAVKSAIESASNLESPRFAALRNAAQTAKHLLTTKQYGADQSYLAIQDHMIREMQVEIEHQLLEVGSQDSHWPKILDFSLNADMSGMKMPTITAQGILSSMKDATNVFKQTTAEYQQNKNQRSEQANNDGPLSSAQIAKKLKYNFEEREQLESVILAQFGFIEKLWSVNNQTIDELPECMSLKCLCQSVCNVLVYFLVIRQQEDALKKGKNFSYSKIKRLHELSLYFPTEMGIPFLFSYEVPTLVKFEGKIKGSSTPSISQSNQLQKPERINAEIDAYMTISAKVQSQLSLITPFDQRIYSAGFDKNIQVHVPVKANADIDVKNKEMKIEFDVQEKHNNARALHYSTWPYTSRSGVLDIAPIPLRPNTLVIKRDVQQHRSIDATFGKSQTGLAFRLWGHHPVQSLTLGDLHKAWQSKNLNHLWSIVWDQSAIEFTEINVAYVPSQSTVRKATFRVRFEQDYKKKPANAQEEGFLSLQQLANKIDSDKAQNRQQEVMKTAGSGIQSADLSSSDISVEFEGDQQFQHICGYAYAKSNADPASRAILYYHNKQQNKQFAFEVKGRVANTNALDLTESLNVEPSAKYAMRSQYGDASEHINNVVKVSAEVKMQRSKARKEYLTEQEPLYAVCKSEMQQGNFQLAACLNMTLQANFLDDVQFRIEHQNLNKRFARTVQQAFQGIVVYNYPMTEEQTAPSEGENVIEGKVQFQPEDFRQANITLTADDQETKFINISTRSQIVKAIFVQHPVYHLRSRIGGLIKAHPTIRPSCVIDQTAAQTFSNKTYQLSIGQQQTVVLQYIPKDAPLEKNHQHSVEEQLRKQIENYVVLTRQVPNKKYREVLISFNHPKSQGKTVEVKLEAIQTSPSNPAAIVKVDGQQVHFDDKNIADLYDGFVQIYSLPNGEVKVEIRDAFYVIFDGKRMRITASSDKLFDSTFGLCGRFSGDVNEDFTVPQKCVVRDAQFFAQNYQVENRNQRRSYRSGEWSQECVEKVLPLYTNVVSENKLSRSKQGLRSQQSGTKLRSRYVEENGELCFSLRPLPVCNGRARNTVSKNVPVHCLQGTKTAYYLKSQIDQGGNPDFSRKPETKTVRMEVPVQCD
ncbi:hypothetical protein HUJ05_003012 [Dendroctonus ponderosae]|nr:hypothetical protein HUJ05_003012 [Dendroctonus ponderosae]